MGKGLPRSHRNASPQLAGVQKLNISLDKLTVTVSAAGAGIGFGSVVIRGLPEGNVQMLGAVLSNFQLSGSGADANLSDTWAGDFAIGTTPASDGTISGDDEDIMVETALAAATAEVSPNAVRTVGITPPMVPINNTANDLELNLNVLIDAADIVDASSVTLTMTGLLSIAYITLGDD